MPKSLSAAIVAGMRPAGSSFKATLQSWLGVPISLKDGEFWRAWGAATGTFTGKRVTVDQALQLSTVWACVRLIAETLATLPLGFYKRNADGSRSPANTHALYEVLHNQPNADMTAVVFWEVVVASMLLWGNAYIEIIRSGRTVIALHFLVPARMCLRRLAGGGYEYRYRDSSGGAEREIAEEDLMHIPAFSTDGVIGLSPVAYGANVFSTSIETDRASAETFRDAMRSPGLVTMDMILKPAQREEIRAHVKDVSDRGGVMVLEKGTGFQKLGFDPVTAELLASRSFNVEEICRWFGLDPVMVGHGAKDSNWGTGLEQKMLWFLIFALRKWCVRIEQSVRKSLLSPVERLTLFAEFNMEGLLRGDSAARASWYSTMTQNGLMTRDECRGKENLFPMGGNAAVLTVQSNMLPIDMLGQNLTQAANDAAAVVKSNAGLMLALAARENSVTVNHASPNVTVHPAHVTMEPAAVTVNPPNVTVNQPEVVVNQAPVTVSVPERPVKLEFAEGHLAVTPPSVDFSAVERMTEQVRADSAASRAAIEHGLGALAETMSRPVIPVYDDDGNLLGAQRVPKLKE